MKSLLMLATGVMFFAGVVDSYADRLDDIQEGNLLRCGYVEAPYWSETNIDGELEGYDIAFCKLIARRLGIPDTLDSLKFVQIPESETSRPLPYLAIDVLVGHIEITSPPLGERFSVPYAAYTAQNKEHRFSILVPSSEHRLLRQINLLIGESVRNGTIQSLHQRYFAHVTHPGLNFGANGY